MSLDKLFFNLTSSVNSKVYGSNCNVKLVFYVSELLLAYIFFNISLEFYKMSNFFLQLLTDFDSQTTFTNSINSIVLYVINERGKRIYKICALNYLWLCESKANLFIKQKILALFP